MADPGAVRKGRPFFPMRNMISRCTCFLVFVSLFFSSMSFAQPSPGAGNTGGIHGDTRAGSITGRVFDVETQKPLPYVNVMVTGTVLGDVSDEAGWFLIKGVPSGLHRLRALFVGYEPGEVDAISVDPNGIAEVEFFLVPAALQGEDVVITAARKEQTALLAPASVGVITSEEINRKSVTTFDQAIEASTGVKITRSSGANVQAFSIRGASEVAGGGTGNRVLLLIDGRPALSPESGGALWTLVPTSSIERIEIVKGAYSSLYGSSAMGGVVNVITKRPTFTPYTRINVNYGFYEKAPSITDYDRFNDYNNLEISHSRKMDDLSFLVDFARKENDGHKAKSGFELYNFYGKVLYNFSNNRNIQLSTNLNLIRNDTPATWLTPRRAYSVAEHRKDDYQDRNEFSADLYYYAIPDPNIKYSSRFYYYRNFSEFTFQEDPEIDNRNQPIAEESIEASRVGNLSQVDFFHGDRHYWIAGAEFQLDNTDARPADVLYGKRRSFNVAGFVQDEVKFTDRLTATAGLRYDYNRIVDGHAEGNLSPKLSFVYEIQKDWSVRTLLAQAFRNPSIAERYIQFEQGGGITFRQSPDLKAEKLYLSAEVGTKFKITEYSSYDIAFFWNEYENLISYVQLNEPGLVFEIRNLNKAVMRGVEANVSVFCKSYFKASIGYTFLDAQDRSKNRTNDVLAYKVKHALTFSSSVDYQRISVGLDGRINSRTEEVFIYPGSEPDAFVVLNSKFRFRLSERQTVYLGVNNLLDDQFEELERYRMPGRSFFVGTMLEF